MLLRDSTGRSVEFHLFAPSGVDSIDYIIDYATDAVNGCNPDFDCKLDADLCVL